MTTPAVERVKKHHDNLRAAGLRPVQIRVAVATGGVVFLQ